MSHMVQPGYGSHRRSFARVVTDGSTDVSPIALDVEGTIDWVFVGALQYSTVPYQSAGASNPPRKRSGDGDLYRGMGWKNGTKGAAPFVQATSRSFTAAAADNASGAAINSNSGSGYLANAAGEMIECGPELYIPAHRQTRRLKVYTTAFMLNTVCRARIINTELDDGKDLIETSELVSYHDYHQWTIDFASQIGGYLYVTIVGAELLRNDGHIKVQAASLAVAP